MLGTLSIAMHYLDSLILLILVTGSWNADYREFIDRQRPSRSYYVITAPEIFTLGETNKIGIDLQGRLADTFVHVVLKKWHGGKLLASASKMMKISEETSPFILNLKIKDGFSEKFALLVVRLLGNQFQQKEILVKMRKKKLKIFIKTNKGIFKPGETIKVWVMVLDFNIKPFKGRINSVMLTDNNGHVADYKRNLDTKRGIASFEMSTQNLQTEGRAELKILVQNHIARLPVFIGTYSDAKSVDNGCDASNRVCRNPPRKGDRILQSRNFMSSMNRKLNQFAAPVSFESLTHLSGKDKLYSASKSTIEILMSSKMFMPGSIAEFTIIYNKPTNGLNPFSYQVVCSEKIIINKEYHDLYTSFACIDSLHLSLNLFKAGPNLVSLCKERKARFSIFFRVTSDMAPRCRILVYRVSSDGELIAAEEGFRVHHKMPKRLSIAVARNIILTDEKLDIQVHYDGDHTLLMSGLQLQSHAGHEDQQMLNEKNILNYCQNRTVPKEILKITKTCNGESYITAGQYFRNSGLKVITDLDADPDIPCAGVRSQGVRRLRQRQSQQQSVPGNDVSAWIWEKIELKHNEQTWKSTFAAPKIPGKYVIETISIDDHDELNVAKKIIVEVKRKTTLKPTEAFKEENSRCRMQKCKEERKQIPIISLQIVPSLDKKIFVLRRCQSLKMKLCVRSPDVIRTKDRKHFNVININMVPGFMMMEKDLSRLMKKRKRRLISFFILSNQVYLFMKKSSKKTCFIIKLKQTGIFRHSHNSATVVHYSSDDRGKKTTVRYWITESDCSRR